MDMGGRCIPASGAVVGESMEGSAGEDSWCFRKGLLLGVGGTSHVEKVVLSNPGV
jgi:hypothetical protein